MHHGVNQAAGKGIAPADTVQNIEREKLALEGVSLIPHIGHQAVLAAAVGIADMPRNTGKIRIAFHKTLEDFILLLISRLERDPVFPVAFAVVVFILPEMIRLDAEQHIHVRQALGTVIPRLFPAPELAAEIPVEADRQALFLRGFHQSENKLGTAWTDRRRNAAQMEPVKAVQQRRGIHLVEVIFRNGAVLPVINDFAGPDAVARFKIVGPQAMGRGLLMRGENHRRAMDVVAAQHADCAFPQRVVRHHAEKRAVHAQIGKRQGNIGFASAIAGFETVGNTDFSVVGRSQPQHDFSKGNKLMSGLMRNWIFMYHEFCSPF